MKKGSKLNYRFSDDIRITCSEYNLACLWNDRRFIQYMDYNDVLWPELDILREIKKTDKANNVATESLLTKALIDLLLLPMYHTAGIKTKRKDLCISKGTVKETLSEFRKYIPEDTMCIPVVLGELRVAGMFHRTSLVLSLMHSGNIYVDNTLDHAVIGTLDEILEHHAKAVNDISLFYDYKTKTYPKFDLQKFTHLYYEGKENVLGEPKLSVSSGSDK